MIPNFAAQRQAMMAGIPVTANSPEISATLARAKEQFASLPQVFANGFRHVGENQQAQQSPSAAELQWGSAGGRENINDSYAAMGFASNVPRSLIHTESGGNWGADNGLGYRGILQFGDARLTDAKRAGVVPAEMTLQEFGSDTPAGRAAQIAAANWHFADIDNRIKANGYDKLVGQTIGGTPITWDGMRAMAHLGGFGGLSSFLKSGGANNASDAFGTSLAAYGRTHSN